MTTPHLSSAWASSTTETHRIDETDPQSMALLKAAFEGVYAPLFTEENGGERLDQWEARLRDYTRKTRYIIIVAGKNLLQAEGQREIMGLAVGIYYKEADVGLLGYLVVAPEARKQGVSKISWQALKDSFVDEAAKYNKPLAALLCECNDPARVSAEKDIFDPRIRFDMYKNWGAREVNMDYICPQEGRDPTMQLLSFPHPITHRYAQYADVMAFLDGYYKIFGITPEKDAAYLSMVRELNLSQATSGSIIKWAPLDKGFRAQPLYP